MLYPCSLYDDSIARSVNSSRSRHASVPASYIPPSAPPLSRRRKTSQESLSLRGHDTTCAHGVKPEPVGWLCRPLVGYARLDTMRAGDCTTSMKEKARCRRLSGQRDRLWCSRVFETTKKGTECLRKLNPCAHYGGISYG
jgi:hypothetical protein